MNYQLNDSKKPKKPVDRKKKKKSAGLKDGEEGNPVPGFAWAQGPLGENVQVPHFMVPDAEVRMQADRKKHEFLVAGRSGGPLPRTNRPYVALAGGDVESPADPPITDREALDVHAEILALQTTHGISYKDATNRFYHAKLERLRAYDTTRKELTNVRQQIKSNVAYGIYRPLLGLEDRIVRQNERTEVHARTAEFKEDEGINSVQA